MIVPLYEIGTGGDRRTKGHIKELIFLKYCEWKPIVCYMLLCENMIYVMIWFCHNSMNMMIWNIGYVMSYGMYHMWIVISFWYDMKMDMIMIHVNVDCNIVQLW